eukprot:scaffold168878_cov33-Tisochrysis_lutea.AAC.1
MHKSHARVVEGCGSALAQELLRDVAHQRVNLAHGDILDAGVLAHLAKDPTITATHDKHRRRVRVREHRQMRDHLLVCKLIALGHLDHSIEDEDSAVGGGFKDEDILEVRASLEEHLLYLDRHRLPGPHHLILSEPAVLDRHRARRASWRAQWPSSPCRYTPSRFSLLHPESPEPTDRGY